MDETRLREWLSAVRKKGRKNVRVLNLTSMVEGSICDIPCNPFTTTDFVKVYEPEAAAAVPSRQPKEGHVSDNDATEKALADLAKAEDALKSAEAAREAMKSELEEAKADLRARNRDLDDLRKQFDAEVNKNKDPEEVFLEKMDPAAREHYERMKARSDAADKMIEKMQNERRLSEIAKQFAEDFPKLPVTGTEMAPILDKVASALDDAEMDELKRVLKAGNDALGNYEKAVGLLGTGGATVTSAEAELDKKAKERAAKDNVSFEKAYAAVLTENPDLYARYESERSATAN